MDVALFTRAWIEIEKNRLDKTTYLVALFTRAWIEIKDEFISCDYKVSRPLHEGVD